MMEARTNSVSEGVASALRQQLKRWLRRPAHLLAFQVVRRISVEDCPTPLADFLEIKVPRSVRPNVVKSPEGGSNIKTIFELLHKCSSVPGAIAECGVFRGSSLLPIGLFTKQHRLHKKVLGFDSFEGFGDSVAFDMRLGGQESTDKRPEGFADTSYQLVHDKIVGLALENVITLNKGFFGRTLSQYSDLTFSFVHLDCDTYQAYKECLDFFYPRVSPGGVILFDEYNDPPWPGCNLAVDEFLADKAERPIEIERDNYEKWYIVKQ